MYNSRSASRWDHPGILSLIARSMNEWTADPRGILSWMLAHPKVVLVSSWGANARNEAGAIWKLCIRPCGVAGVRQKR